METEYANHYRCECGEVWMDIWSCMCNDRCPKCDTEIEPYKSYNIEEKRREERAEWQNDMRYEENNE